MTSYFIRCFKKTGYPRSRFSIPARIHKNLLQKPNKNVYNFSKTVWAKAPTRASVTESGISTADFSK